MPDHLDSAVPDPFWNWSEAEEFIAYRMMLQIRRFEEKAAQLYALGHITILAPLSIGQEAVATGLSMAARPADKLIAGSRCHGFMLARGVEPKNLMSSLLDQREGTRAQPEVANDLAATLTEIASQCAHGQAAVWCVGDGSDEQGQMFDTIMRVVSAKLPVIFIVENTSSELPDVSLCRALPSALTQRCEAAGVRVASVNGLDVRHVKAAAGNALDEARQGRGAVVLDIMTYSYRGHGAGGSPAQKVRPREQTDPLAKARARIAIKGGAEIEARLRDLETAVRAEVSAALTTARAGLTAA